MAIKTTGVRYDVIAKDSASKVFKSVGNSAGKLDGRMGKLTKSIAYAGAALAGSFAAAAAVSAKKAVAFEAEMTKISTQAGGTARDVAVLSKGVLELGKTTQQGPEKLAEAMYHLKSVGMDNTLALKSLKVASDLAAVGNADLEDTTNALAGAWRSGIKGAGTFAQAAATVNAVIGAGNMRMEDFVAAIGTGILPSAKSFGLSLKQVGAALALMTDEGIPATAAATRLRMSFSLLGAPSKAAEKQLKKIHLTGLQLATAMRGPDGIIGAISLLKTHLDASGMSAAQQSQLLSRAFGGGRSSSGILTLLNNLDVLKQKQDQVNKSTGRFGPAVEAQRKTVQAQMKLIESNLEVLSIQAGDKLLPPLSRFTTFVTTSVLPRLGSVVSYIDHTMIPTVSDFGQTMVDRFIPVKQIEQRFTQVKTAVSDFLTGFAVKPPKPKTVRVPAPQLEPATTAIPGWLQKAPNLTIPAPQLKPSTTKIPKYLQAPLVPKTQAQQMGEEARKLISDGISDAISKINWGKVGSVVGRGLGTAIDWIGAHGSDLTKRLAKAIGRVDWVDVGKTLGVLFLPMVIGATDNMFEPLFHKDFWKKHWLDVIIAAISALPVSDVAGAVAKPFKRLPWGKIGDTIAGGFSKIPWSKAGDALARVPWSRIFRWTEYLTDPIGSALTHARGLASRAGDELAKPFRSINWGKIGDFFVSGARKIGDALDRVPWSKIFRWTDYIIDPLGSASKAAGRFATRLGDAFIRGIKSGWSRVGQALSDQLTLLPVRIGDLGRLLRRKIKSTMAEAGETLVKSIPGWNNKFFRAIYKFFGRYSLYQIGVQLTQGLISGIGTGLSGIGHWLKVHMVDPVVNWVKNLFGVHSPSTVFAGIGSDLIAGLLGGILIGAAGIGKWLGAHVVAPVRGAFAGAGGWLYGHGHDVVDGLESGAWSVAKGTAGWFRTNVADRAVGVFVKAGGWLYSHGSDLVSGLLGGALALADDAKHGVEHWAGTVKDKIVGAIKHVFGIHSPSRVMAELGSHMMSGLLQGLLQGKDILEAAVKGLFHSPLDAAKVLLANGVRLPGEWAAELLGAAAPSGNAPLGKGVKDAQNYAAELISEMWPKADFGTQMGSLKQLWDHESGWRWDAKNPVSGAYGIPQALPADKMASAGSDWQTNPRTQIIWGLNYIKSRYGEPSEAWGSWLGRSPHWYAAGGLAPFGQTAWVGEKGPELMQVTRQGTRIYSSKDSMAIAGATGLRLPGYASGTAAGARASDAQRRVNAAQRAVDYWRRQERAARTKARKRIDQALLEAAEKKLAAAKKELAAANKAATASKNVANTLANGWLKSLETGTAAAIASAVKSMNSKLQAAGAGGLVAGDLRVSGQLQTLATRKAAIAKQIAAAQSYAADQASSLGDFLGIGSTTATTPGQLIQQMNGAQATARSFATLVANLSKRGLNKDLLAQLAQAGPGSGLQALFKNLSAGDIAQLNKLAASQTKLTTSFGNTMADAMYDSGAQAGKGFLAGLKAQEAALQAEMDKLAAGMVNTIKKRLGIKSPSTVFRDQVGKQIALGTAVGITAHAHHARTAAQRMADTAAAVRPRSVAARPAASAAPGGEQPFYGELVLDSGEFLGYVRGVVRPMLRESEKKRAFRERVGPS